MNFQAAVYYIKSHFSSRAGFCVFDSYSAGHHAANKGVTMRKAEAIEMVSSRPEGRRDVSILV
jgi:hypothetical protein